MSNRLVVDGTNFIYRAIHSARSDDDRTPQSELIWLVRWLGNLVADFRCTEVYFVLDGKVSAYRRAVYPDYKRKGKEPKSEEDRLEKEIIKSRYSALHHLLYWVLSPTGVRVCYHPYYEGDDLVYQIVQALAYPEEKGKRILTATGDKDLLQVLRFPNSQYYYSRDGMVYDKNHLLDMSEITGGFSMLEEYIVAKSLIGDPSDGIPGVKGIGKVRAKQILDATPKYNEGDFLGALHAWAYSASSQDIASPADKYKEKIQENWSIIKRNYRLIDLSQEPVLEPDVLHRIMDGRGEVSYTQVMDYFKWSGMWGFSSANYLHTSLNLLTQHLKRKEVTT